MQRSFLAKSSVHFADLGFFVKVGDILVHDTSNSNRLTVYRNGVMVKTLGQTTLGLAAMQKSGFIEEVTQQPRMAPKAPPKPVEPLRPALRKEESRPPTKRKEEPKLASTKKEEYSLAEALEVSGFKPAKQRIELPEGFKPEHDLDRISKPKPPSEDVDSDEENETI